jgi:uncharacterized membrane protein YczE
MRALLGRLVPVLVGVVLVAVGVGWELGAGWGVALLGVALVVLFTDWGSS